MTNGPAQVSKRALQAVVALGALIPIAVGGIGAIFGFEVFGHGLAAAPPVNVASHGKYVSGLLLGVGLAYLSTVPHIESKGARFHILTFIVFVGGLARLLSLLVDGVPSLPMIGGLAMELVVAPLLAVWRERVEQRSRRAP